MTDAVTRCLDLNIEFAAVFAPGKDQPLLFSDIGGAAPSIDGDWFCIKPFGIDKGTKPRLIPAIADNEILKLDRISISSVFPDKNSLVESTPYDIYQNQVNQIVESLKRDGGKTVISRVIDLRSSRSFTDVLDEYFIKFIYTIRFVYNFKDTGLWFGATPELLLDYDLETKLLKTMSLAGTRPSDDRETPWDVKNIEEHQYVTDYIMSTLTSHGLAPEIYDSSPLQYGSIQHLCDRIQGRGDVDIFSLLDDMSPTPALCGIPKEKAYRQIIETELHDRKCYGGWLAFKQGNHIWAYVNLRSACVQKSIDGTYRYNLFVGGGLTSQSKASDEWEETNAKASTLYKIITK